MAGNKIRLKAEDVEIERNIILSIFGLQGNSLYK